MATDTGKNLGIASIKVEILPVLPGIVKDSKKRDFDIPASYFETVVNSPTIRPFFTEYLKDPLGTFASVFPKKRIKYVDNFLKGSSRESGFKALASDAPYISWTPSQTLPAKTVFNELKSKFRDVAYDPEKIVAASQNNATDEYNGPIWDDLPQPYTAPTDDKSTISKYLAYLAGADTTEQEPTPAETPSTILPQHHQIIQEKVLDGLWWGIESDPFITPQMPFWIIIDKDGSPSSSQYETLFIISLGTDTSERYDIYLSADNHPRLIDYDGPADAKPTDMTWENDVSRIIKEESHIEIGVMTVAGRLVVYVNQEPMVYLRINKSSGDNNGKAKPCTIPAGKVKLFGTNVRAKIYAGPMTFAPVSAFAIPLPSKAAFEKEGGTDLAWKGISHQGAPLECVAMIPLSTGKIGYGVDCESFDGDGGECSPDGTGFHKLGKITFKNASTINAINQVETAEKSSLENYLVAMSTGNGKMMSSSGTEVDVENSGCPYFFRLKGAVFPEDPIDNTASGVDISNLVISANETTSTSDYYSIRKTASVTCYNPNGALSGLLRGQKGIRIYWGWNGETTLSLTGIVLSTSVSQKAGMETITLDCQDYMFILKEGRILNSPHYDGMLATFAVLDLAKRAGCIAPVEDANDDGSNNNFFLPSGEVYTSPRCKLGQYDSYESGMTKFAQQWSLVYFFDNYGVFHIKRLKGGLFGNFKTATAAFFQDPKHSAKDKVILGEKNIKVDYASTASNILCFSVDRESMNYIVAATENKNNNVLYRRVVVIQQGMYGELEVARAAVKDMGTRLFFPILQCNFKTAGGDATIQPLDFVTVDGQPFRIMSIKRDFNAENNDFTQTYDAEWKSGNNAKTASERLDDSLSAEQP